MSYPARAEGLVNSTFGFSNKKAKQNPADLENKAAEFPQFIILESLEETYQTKLSSFLIENVISSRATSQIIKKTRNNNLLVEVNMRDLAP